MAILNDVASGDIWNPERGAKRISIQWSTASTDRGEQRGANESASKRAETFDDTCSAQNGPISAVDDSIAVRANKRHVIDVLSNDEQSDCSVLRITAVSPPHGSPINVSIVNSGRSILVDAGVQRPSKASFTYTINDGRGQSSSATVILDIIDDSANSPPQQDTSQPRHEVEQGAVFSTNALASFSDAQGDAMMLVSARALNSDDAKSHMRPDGLLTFDAGSAPLGRISVEVEVSDGAQTSLGLIHFLVRPKNTLAAFADACAVSVVVDSPVTIDLRRYIHGNSADEPEIASFDVPEHARVTRTDRGFSLSFTADRVGTYHMVYTIRQGDMRAPGLVRIEVVAPGGQEGEKPVAVNDTAVLGTDGTAVIEPLSNDVDPKGGVLAANSVQADVPSGVAAVLVNHHRVIVKAQRMGTRPIDLIYTASNAAGESHGTITLFPPAAAQGAASPRAADIKLSVRTESMVSADMRDWVTAFPADFTLERTLRYEPKTFAGTLSVSDRLIRYLAPAKPGEYTATYTVHDRQGNASSGMITWKVHASDAKSKAASSPRDVEAQVDAGHAVAIEIPLRGIDKDGEDIMLLGLGNIAPRLGRIAKVDATSLTYEAYPDSSGTDSFSYAIEDWTGQRTQANIRIGITRTPSERRVYARDDEIAIRPGTFVTVPVTDNDISSIGEHLTVSADLETHGVSDAKATAGSISFTAPRTEGTAHIAYAALDGAGLSAQATLTIRIDAKAPLNAPIARDYRVPASATVSKRTVQVDIAPLIANPSGPDAELHIDIPGDENAWIHNPENKTLARRATIELCFRARIVPYRVTNTVQKTSTVAFIHVPAYGVFAPMLRPKAPPLTVHAGETLVIAVADYVRVGAGKNVSIDANSPVNATKNTNGDLRADAQTLRFTAVAGYHGPASISFTATDAGDAAQSGSPGTTHAANYAILTLPITILDESASPPVFIAPTVEIAAGDTSSTIDFNALIRPHGGITFTAKGPNDIPYAFSGGMRSSSIEAKVSASGQFSVRAWPSAPVGTRTVVPVVIAYPGGIMRTGVSVHVVTSRRALASVQNQQLRIIAGSSLNVDLFEGAYNPFPDTPLTVTGCVRSDETIHVGCAANGKLTITAPPGIPAAARTLTIDVQDATRSKERQVSAIIIVTTVGRPSPPRILPSSVQAGDATVTLRWAASTPNGGAVSDYRIVWNDGSQSCGAVTICRIDGLTNNREYALRVQALNDAGWSDLSSPVTVRPDKAPSAPRAVRVEAGYRQAAAHWDPPLYEGSSPEAYTVTLSNTHGWQKTITVKSSPAIFDIDHASTGDGVAFSATVTARSRAGQGASAESPHAYVWSDPDPPSISLEQVDDTIHVTLAPRDQHNAGCSAITLEGSASAKAGCAASVIRMTIESAQFWKPFTIAATLHPRMARAANSLSSASLTPQYALSAPRNVSLTGLKNHCVVSWQGQGKHDGFVATISGLGTIHTEESEESAIFSLDPWQRCTQAEVVQTLNKRAGPTATAHGDHQYKTPAIIMPPNVSWAQNHNHLALTAGSVETWGQPAAIRLIITTSSVTKEYTWQPGATDILIDLPDADAYLWSIVVMSTLGEPELYAKTPDRRIEGIRKPANPLVAPSLDDRFAMPMHMSAFSHQTSYPSNLRRQS